MVRNSPQRPLGNLGEMASDEAPVVAPAYDVEPAGGNRQVYDGWHPSFCSCKLARSKAGVPTVGLDRVRLRTFWLLFSKKNCLVQAITQRTLLLGLGRSLMK